VGGVIYGMGGIPWAALLLAFFLSSSLLSRAFASRKEDLHEKFAKGSRRDAGQVLANGGLGAALALAYGFFPGQSWLWLAYAGALATVTADTWATEIGVLSAAPPRLITSGRQVERGASGGVTLLGVLATLLGAGLIGLLAGGLRAELGAGAALLVVAAGGLIGALFDSLLGATVQAIYHCPRCQKETEQHPAHNCGTPTILLRGWRWLSNDRVNFLSSILGAAVSAGVWLLIS
jgi:uncharacterized protein (TIGR00297 family)